MKAHLGMDIGDIVFQTVEGVIAKGSGATLEQSPPVIEIRFLGSISLSSVVVVDASKAERKLEFTPHAAAAVFQLPNPQLAAGKSEIKWKGLSKDGHVVTGSLVYEVKPKA